MTLKAGTKLGPYEIMALIAAGGMGEVYRARERRGAILPCRLSEESVPIGP
jgi:hypothetical protein